MRHRTLAGGAGLGLLMLAALTLAGSLISRTTPSPQPPARPIEPGTLSAAQPELERAMLHPSDLAGNYTAVPKATVRRLPEPERCSALLDPESLMRNIRVAEATDQASTTLAGPTQVSQLLTTFADSGGATATMLELERVTQRCKDFQAVLDDGTPVRVQVKTDPIDADTCAVHLLLTGGGKVTRGVLTLRRVGQVLSVLRELGSDGVVDSLKLVDMTLDRLTQTH